jgi:hypothetical protein
MGLTCSFAGFVGDVVGASALIDFLLSVITLVGLLTAAGHIRSARQDRGQALGSPRIAPDRLCAWVVKPCGESMPTLVAAEIDVYRPVATRSVVDYQSHQRTRFFGSYRREQCTTAVDDFVVDLRD